MIEKRIEGFLLKKVPYKDNDAIINVLTKNGLETFKARGILKNKSKNANSCNYNMISEFTIVSSKEGGNSILKSSSSIKMYYAPYDNMLLMSSFLFISNVSYLVCENIDVYDLAISCFDKLEHKENAINVLVYFLKEVCNLLGYKPNIKGCVNCNNKNNLISFSLKEGGFICKNCFIDNYFERYSNELLKEIYNLYKENNYLGIDQIRAFKLFSIYVSFMKDEVGIPISNEKLIYESRE